MAVVEYLVRPHSCSSTGRRWALEPFRELGQGLVVVVAVPIWPPHLCAGRLARRLFDDVADQRGEVVGLAIHPPDDWLLRVLAPGHRRPGRVFLKPGGDRCAILGDSRRYDDPQLLSLLEHAVGDQPLSDRTSP